MSLPSSLQSYGDCLDFFEKVVDDPLGGRVCLVTREEAHNFRLRCNYFRQLHRQQNAKIHEEGTPMHGASEYDPFQLKLREDTGGEWWVYAIRTQLDATKVELLSELEDSDGNEAQSNIIP